MLLMAEAADMTGRKKPSRIFLMEYDVSERDLESIDIFQNYFTRANLNPEKSWPAYT